MLSFDGLNKQYNDIEGTDLLLSATNEDIDLQRYILDNVIDGREHLTYYTPEKSGKQRTADESDVYFQNLIEKLTTELIRRGCHESSADVAFLGLLYEDTNRFTEMQLHRTMRDQWSNELLEYGLNKTNAKAIATMMMRLVLEHPEHTDYSLL